jgi:hypothetical protein
MIKNKKPIRPLIFSICTNKFQNLKLQKLVILPIKKNKMLSDVKTNKL